LEIKMTHAFTFTTINQGFIAARSKTWTNPTHPAGFLPIVNREGKQIVELGPNTLDVTHQIHNHEALNIKLNELIVLALKVSKTDLTAVSEREANLTKLLERTRFEREQLMKLAARSEQNPSGMTFRQIGAAVGLSHQRVAQIVSA